MGGVLDGAETRGAAPRGRRPWPARGGRGPCRHCRRAAPTPRCRRA